MRKQERMFLSMVSYSKGIEYSPSMVHIYKLDRIRILCFTHKFIKWQSAQQGCLNCQVGYKYKRYVCFNDYHCYICYSKRQVICLNIRLPLPDNNTNTHRHPSHIFQQNRWCFYNVFLCDKQMCVFLKIYFTRGLILQFKWKHEASLVTLLQVLFVLLKDNIF